MAEQPVEVWLKVTTTSPPTTLKSTLEIWTVVPEQLDGEALSAHAAVMPAPESAAAMDATAIAGTTLLRHDGHYGNGLLARCKCIVRSELVDLSWRSREPRGAICADLDFGDGHLLKVVATHLGLRPAERREQVERLIQLFSWHEQERGVLMGDVNEWFLWGRPLKKLHRYFTRTPAVATFPSRRPVFALDRLWTHPGAMLKDLKAHVSPLARVASDHLPLVARIEI